MDRTRVTRILSRARFRTDPADYPQLDGLRLANGMKERGTGRGRRVGYLTQQEIDLLLGFDTHSGHRLDFYCSLERASLTSPPDHLLRAAAKILRLSEAQWSELHLAVHGYKAPRPLSPEAGRRVAPAWKLAIHSSTVPAYISTFEWDVIDHNSAADALFGGVPSNVMRWILSLPPYSHSRCRMPDWTENWGPVALSQLRFALNEEPQNQTLREVETEVQAGDLAEMYHHQRDPYIHPDGARRKMIHHGQGAVGIMDAAASEPIGSPGCRVVYMHWSPLDSASAQERVEADVQGVLPAFGR
ncbi:MmyB family transcriptional regulator [Streptomyces albireticuli]|uniref:MmyB-like transcription regulator ligand binding domain-containing protein n=1 Tax=Streptomyces albireticuli TaxID=1940 RepID=A0A2A2D1U1_9ACTN|nr:hypothetical protein [Streptomyces albireticuli]MCD9146182.1 hypothetical protein [Streptomyces albireticuli]MCD9165738.1 hypothetical protein [Streptomyces albireticuli]MCD9195956.1 hypothetical protein [Streptomyces albireticuli]PAU46393.1 hypothetical protein CK936_24300 [Streptomyces albireticuli]